MAETNVFQPEPLDGMQLVSEAETSAKLDAEVSAFLRGKFTIESANYYTVSADIPWIAVSKSVQNQMAEQSIQRIMFDWYEPGIDFVEIYPQDHNKAAFALAMPEGSSPKAEKFVGFYVLSAP